MAAVPTVVPDNSKAVAKASPAKELQNLLEKYKDQIAMALPRHMTPERMIRVAMTAFTTTPALWECSVNTIAACIVQSSILGLEPNSVLGEAYLIPFNRKVKERGKPDRWVKDCQLIVGYQGLLKLVRQSGELLTINAQPVRERDDFDFENGLDPYLRHKYGGGSAEERGPVVSYWAGAVLKGGGRQFVVMTVPEVIDHRNKYSKGWEKQGESSTWGKEFDQMAMKTCIRKLAKLLPKSIERDSVSSAINLDERAEVGATQRFSVDVPLELHPPVDDGGDGESEGVGAERMPQRLSEKKLAETEASLAEKVRQAKEKRVAELAALPDLPTLPDPMEYEIGAIIRHKGELYITNLDRSAWEAYKPKDE